MKMLMLGAVCALGLLFTGCASCKDGSCSKSAAHVCTGDCCKDAATCKACCGDAPGACAKCCKK